MLYLPLQLVTPPFGWGGEWVPSLSMSVLGVILVLWANVSKVVFLHIVCNYGEIGALPRLVSVASEVLLAELSVEPLELLELVELLLGLLAILVDVLLFVLCPSLDESVLPVLSMSVGNSNSSVSRLAWSASS